MKWLTIAILAVIGLASGLYPSLDRHAVQACGEEGPYDFDTHERADYVTDYALAIELATAGAIVDSVFTISGEEVDLKYQGVEKGPRSARVPANKDLRIPPTLYKSMVWIEANWANAAGTVPYGGVGPTLRSFDCGYGLGQITTGMGNSTGSVTAKQAIVGTHPLFNLAEGVRILADKWNAAPERLPVAGSGDPAAYEDWYYAVWAYNGLWIGNHPLSPRFDPLRGGNETSPLYHCLEPNAHSYQDNGFGFVKFGYGDYTYPERVFGCMKYPPRYYPDEYDVEPAAFGLSSETPAALTGGLAPGATAKISAGGDCLRLRPSPGTVEPEITCLPDGTIVTIVSGPVAVGVLDWWEADTPAGRGWLADIFLELDDPSPTATPLPLPTPTPGAPPVPLPPPELEGPRLWEPAVFRMPEFGHPAIAKAFAPAIFSGCEDVFFAGGCPSMDYPTLIPDWGIAPHGDPTLPVDPASAKELLGAPQLVVSGPGVIVIDVDPDNPEAGDTIEILNAGTGVAPFRIRASHPWIRIRHPDDDESRTLDASVAVGAEMEVVIERQPRTTQQGFSSKLKITVDPEAVPDGITTGSVVIEPLIGGAGPIVIGILAWNQDGPPVRQYTTGLPNIGRD